MPLPTVDLLYPETPSQDVGFALEPALNVHQSMILLVRAEEVSGLDEWVYRTVAEMSPEERQTHELVMIGLFFATRPDASYPSYPAFLEHLAALSPLDLRDRVVTAYARYAMPDVGAPAPAIDDILADFPTYLDFLSRGFEDELIDTDVERRAYTYLLDPPALQQMVVNHLRHMWHKYLAVEWERVRPTLQKAVAAYQQLDLSGLTHTEIAQRVLDRDDERFISHFAGCAADGPVTFVPNAHVGPYVGIAPAEDHSWIVFGVRQPSGIEMVPELGRAEILIRLSALSDDTRLSILKLLSEQGEMRSQDIMQELRLSQSGASRHLSQLAATGFVRERRCNGAKCYELNEERVEDTLLAVGGYLLP